MLNIKNLFEMQHVLDQRIITERKMTHDRFGIVIMALLVEIGECANETRCFKDWSDKPASENHIILEEYVDGLHFVLSLGLLAGKNNELSIREITDILDSLKGLEKAKDDDELTTCFKDVYQDVIDYGSGYLVYNDLISGYLYLGLKLGFNVREIESGYFYKNNKNHERQNNGY